MVEFQIKDQKTNIVEKSKLLDFLANVDDYGIPHIQLSFLFSIMLRILFHFYGRGCKIKSTANRRLKGD